MTIEKKVSAEIFIKRLPAISVLQGAHQDLSISGEKSWPLNKEDIDQKKPQGLHLSSWYVQLLFYRRGPSGGLGISEEKKIRWCGSAKSAISRRF